MEAEAVTGYALGSAQALVYAALDSEWRQVGDVARRAGMDPARASAPLRSMAKAGIIEVRKAPGEGNLRNREVSEWRRVRCPGATAAGSATGASSATSS